MFKNSLKKGMSLFLAISVISLTLPVYSAEYKDTSLKPATMDDTELESNSSTNISGKNTEDEKKIKSLEAQIKMLKAKKTQQRNKDLKSDKKKSSEDRSDDSTEDRSDDSTNNTNKKEDKKIKDNRTIKDNKTIKEFEDIEIDNKSKKEIKDQIKEVEDEDRKVDSLGDANIYPWLPSMKNIFKGQTVQEVQVLKPFGYEIFNQDSSVLSSTIDAPIGSDYIIGAGDELQINIWGSVSTSLDVTVDREGKIVLPEVGTFSVSGRTFGSLKEQIRQKLSEIFNNVSVDVSLTKLRKLKIYVVGEAKNPGSYDITATASLFNVLFMAGGPTDIGSLRNISILRNSKVIKRIDLYNFILKGDKSGDVKLENGDTIYFNLKGKTVGVQGLVTRPAIYELKAEQKLTDILALAGGSLATSYLKNVQVKRVEANKEMITLNVDLSSKTKISSFTVKDKDVVTIFPILQVDNQTIYLNGHVFRPGTYQYKSKMKLSQVIKSYDDLLPEPYTEYAQIVRLQKPDYKPLTIMFNLSDVLKGKKDINLQPFDTIIIYSKWAFTRVPEIEIQGEIFKPGKYKIVKGMRLIDIVPLAGGITKDTYSDRIEFVRKDDVYGNKKNISVSLKEALKGDAKNNIEIKDEDIIIFHSNKEITEDKMVSIAGQITKPGSFFLGKGMRVKDLLNLGGNFNKAAYTKEAELIRYYNDGKDIKFKTINIDLQKALAGNPNENLLLQDLDRLLIKQITNWTDIGMTIELKGQVKYPGVYAVSPDDRIYDVIQRAGGYLNNAYLRGAVFNRKSVLELQRQRLDKLMEDIESSIILEENQLIPEKVKNLDPAQLLLKQQKLEYRRKLLEKMKDSDATGRMIVDLTQIDKFKTSDSNVRITPGDILTIPKRPDFVSVQGEVYNQTAIIFKPGKNLGYYLSQSGGLTPDGDFSRVHLVKANGTIIANENKWFYDVKSEPVEAGDTILVPQLFEKTDYLEAVRSIVDIAYKTATVAGIFLITNSNNNRSN